MHVCKILYRCIAYFLHDIVMSCSMHPCTIHKIKVDDRLNFKSRLLFQPPSCVSSFSTPCSTRGPLRVLWPRVQRPLGHRSLPSCTAGHLRSRKPANCLRETGWSRYHATESNLTPSGHRHDLINWTAVTNSSVNESEIKSLTDRKPVQPRNRK